MPDRTDPACATARAQTADADPDPDPAARRAAIEQWLHLRAIARAEPSRPVWRPRSRRARALFLRVDARWRALLDRARRGARPADDPPPSHEPTRGFQ